MILTLKYDAGDVETYPAVIRGDMFTMDDIVYTKRWIGDSARAERCGTEMLPTGSDFLQARF